MRQARIKVDAAKGAAIYHCMTRTVNGEPLFDQVAKEVLRKQLWQVADFCGLEIITYAVMHNHFHVLVRVPRRIELTDRELIRRYRVLHPKPTKYQVTRFEVIEAQLQQGGTEGQAWRSRQLALMGDLSPFMKLVKQRFSIWYNRNHNRYGTLWAERFKSVLVEANPGILRTMAAYIDLNAVRAGLVNDPKDYRFCGYGEAVVGNTRAREGLRLVSHGSDWTRVQSVYRQTLFGKGSRKKANAGRLSTEDFERVIAEKGNLPLAAVLRCRVRYFSDGAVLGSRAFVQSYSSTYQKLACRRTRPSPREVPRVTEWGDLTTLRGLRRQAFG